VIDISDRPKNRRVRADPHDNQAEIPVGCRRLPSGGEPKAGRNSVVRAWPVLHLLPSANFDITSPNENVFGELGIR